MRSTCPCPAVSRRCPCPQAQGRVPPGLKRRSRSPSPQPPVPLRLRPSPPCGPVRVIELASPHPNHRRRAPRILASLAGLAPRTQQHHPHRLRHGPHCRATSVFARRSITITGPEIELACCHSRAWPLNVTSSFAWFSCASWAMAWAGPCPPRDMLSWPAAAGSSGCHPCRYPAMSPSRFRVQSVPRLLRHVHLVRRQLHRPIFHPRTHRQVQPLPAPSYAAWPAVARIGGSAALPGLRRRLAPPAPHARPASPTESRSSPHACDQPAPCASSQTSPSADRRLPSPLRPSQWFPPCRHGPHRPSRSMLNSVRTPQSIPPPPNARALQAALPRWLSPVITTPPVP